MQLSPTSIIQVVAAARDVTTEDILGKCRRRWIAHSRHLAAYVLREQLCLSLWDTARVLKYADHTCVVAALLRVKRSPNLTQWASQILAELSLERTGR